MAVNDSLHSGEPKPPPGEFGGEKWIKDPGPNLFCHATASIADRQLNSIGEQCRANREEIRQTNNSLRCRITFGDALRRRVAGLLDGEVLDVFPLATRRCDSMIADFRSRDIGQRAAAHWVPSSVILFLEMADFVERTISLDDKRFAKVCLPLTSSDMMTQSWRVESLLFKHLEPLGLSRTWNGILVPEAQEGFGLERWNRAIERATAKPPEMQYRPMLSPAPPLPPRKRDRRSRK